MRRRHRDRLDDAPELGLLIDGPGPAMMGERRQAHAGERANKGASARELDGATAARSTVRYRNAHLVLHGGTARAMIAMSQRLVEPTMGLSNLPKGSAECGA